MNIRYDVIIKDIKQGFLVGGCIRDFLMGKKFADRDIAIKNAEIFSHDLAGKLNATLITLDSENKIYRIILKDKKNYIDVSELRGETIEDDLLERDFTINSIAYNLENDKFIDITGGVNDIKNGVIRGIREKNFVDDPLRILRAYRFSATLGFELNRDLEEILDKHKMLIFNPAKERIHDEIMKLFGGKYTSMTLMKMYENGFLELLFPCVKEMEKIPSNTHHHLDLIHHVIETVRNIELIYEKSDNKVREHLDTIEFGGFPRINHLKLAGFLHDIGKYSTWTIEESGRHRFIKHDIKGAEMVVPLLKGLKFSNKQIDYISEMIKKHIYPSNVIKSPNLDDKVIMRYIRKMENNVIDNIILAKADRLSAQGPAVTKEMVKENIDGLNKLLNYYLNIKDSLKPLPKLLDGNEVMNILSINPSPILGQVMNEIKESQINGDISTKEEAIEFVKNYKLNHSGQYPRFTIHD